MAKFRYCQNCKKVRQVLQGKCEMCFKEFVSGTPKRPYKPDRSFEKDIDSAYEKAANDQKRYD